MLAREDAEFLARVPIFAALPGSSLDRLVALARRVDYAGPAVVCTEGEPAREMFLVVRGLLEVRKRGATGGDIRIAVLRPGDVAGEMALIDIQPRSASLRTLGPSSLLILTSTDLASLHREDPEAYLVLVLNIAREISRRLRRLDGLLANILHDVQGVWAGAMAEASGHSGEPR